MGCDALLKGTKVDGVYDADPEKQAGQNAMTGYPYGCFGKDLKVMDASAISLSRENRYLFWSFLSRMRGDLMMCCNIKGLLPLFVRHPKGRVQKLPYLTLKRHRKRNEIMLDLDDVKRRMEASVASLSNEFAGLRAGRVIQRCLSGDGGCLWLKKPLIR